MTQGNQVVDWTDAHVETVKRLWTAGFSYSEIAKKIPSATREAIAGKVHRLVKAGKLRRRTSKVKLQPPNGDKHPPAAAKRVA